MRGDNKTRFSDPPAPPPQQPLPEKPDVAPLKRGLTERPKAQSPNSSASPIRQDANVSQILQLTEALSNAKKEIEAQTSRMHDLENMLHKEREARELAEELARRLEEAAAAEQKSGLAPEAEGPELTLEEAFEPPTDSPASPDAETPTSEVGTAPPAPAVEKIESSATHLQSQLESMVSEMRELRQQLEAFKQRAETAEEERDSTRKTLAEMALQIRRDNEAREEAAREKSRSRSKARTSQDDGSQTLQELDTRSRASSSDSYGGRTRAERSIETPSLSRANTLTQLSWSSGRLTNEEALANGLPYASMLGVVLIGMGLMAYINGWQTQQRFDR